MSKNLPRAFSAALLIAVVILVENRVNAHQFDGESARELDGLLQDYAYRALVRPRTGRVYEAESPANVSGIKLSVIRLRSGSLRRWGVAMLGHFSIPRGVDVTPNVFRLALVYQDLGKWSSVYYNVPGYTFLAPVVGLLAYHASDLSANHLPDLNIFPSIKPISIKFSDRSLVPRGQMGRCVHFGLNGTYRFTDLESGNLCRTNTTGHFSVAVETTAKGGIQCVVASIAGVLGLILILQLLTRYGRKKKIRASAQRHGRC